MVCIKCRVNEGIAIFIFGHEVGSKKVIRGLGAMHFDLLFRIPSKFARLEYEQMALCLLFHIEQSYDMGKILVIDS